MRYKVTSVGQNTGAAYPRTLTAGERIGHKALRTSHFNVYSSLGWWRTQGMWLWLATITE